MSESLTSTVPVAAAIKCATTPHIAPVRKCPVCGEKPPAGVVRCAGCRA